ncbi:MAG: hypothetical protein AAFX79_07125 [Planctomycetota bacterium]
MLDRRRNTKRTLVLASMAAMTPMLLADQDNRAQDRERAAERPNAAPLYSGARTNAQFRAALREAALQNREARIWQLAGPSRIAVGPGRSIPAAPLSSVRRQYTDRELRELIAAHMKGGGRGGPQTPGGSTGGPGSGPSGGTGGEPGGGSTISHPSLGKFQLIASPGGPSVTLTPIGPGVTPTTVSVPPLDPTVPIDPTDPPPSSPKSGGPVAPPVDPGGSPGGGDPGGGPPPPPPDPGTVPVLTPGGGFSGPTATPGPVGSPGDAGYDARAIARWDVVPFQKFDGVFYVGVVAFHINGIDRVEFSADGGPWTPSTSMTLNPRTGVWEYMAALDASLFDDGPVEVRARVIPRDAGQARVLAGNNLQVTHGGHSLFLHADASGVMRDRVSWVDPTSGSDANDGLTEATAKKTIDGGLRALDSAFGAIDGGTVYLLEGTHDWYSRNGTLPDPETAMVTIAAAPGLDPSQVILGDVASVSGRELRVDKVHLSGLTIQQVPGDTSSASHPTQLWVEDCVAEGGGLTSLHNIPSAAEWQLGLYITDTQIRNARVGVKTNARFIRNVSASRLGEDAFTNVLMILNSTASELVKGAASYHADVVQYTESQENTIVYGLEAVDQQAQTIFSRGDESHDNAAFVNVLIEGGHAGTGLLGQWIRNSNHVLFWNTTLVGTPFWFRSGDPSGGSRPVTNLSIRNSVFEEVSYPGSGYPEGSVAFQNSHFLNSGPLGSGATSGGSYETLFLNPSGNDFSPRSGGVLDARIVQPLTPADARNQPIPVGGSIGSLQPSSDPPGGD